MVCNTFYVHIVTPYVLRLLYPFSAQTLCNMELESQKYGMQLLLQESECSAYGIQIHFD
jgi:hypothetical protein